MTITDFEPGDRNLGPSLLEMRDIGKVFAGNRVLDRVCLDLRAGEVHVLAGENGAGKSTLIKILAGVHTDYEGHIFLANKPIHFRSPHEAATKGISVIYQEMSLIPTMSVLDNVFLGREKTRLAHWLDSRTEEQRAAELLRQLDLQIDLHAPIEAFAVSVQQMIEIAKALAFDAKILVMDEPTSTLTEHEVHRLFLVIEVLKARGCGILYISHKMEEIYSIADRITVLRDGQHVGTAARKDLPQSELVRWMVGREITQQFPSRATACRQERLVVKHLSVPNPVKGLPPLVDDISITVKAGEILGLAGLQGSGVSELLHGLFGAYGRLSGSTMLMDGKPVSISCPREALNHGLALLTNDRKVDGLVPGMSLVKNITLASLKTLAPLGWLLLSREIKVGQEYVKSFRIKATSVDQEIEELSGGNQQKVLLSRWLATQPAVLLLDQPTRGIDIGAKQEIYSLMNEWTQAGCALLLVTSEMPELLALADRILVLHRGRVTAEFTQEESTQERILRAAMGTQQESPMQGLAPCGI